MKIPDKYIKIILTGPLVGATAQRIVAKQTLVHGALKVRIDEITEEKAFRKTFERTNAAKYLERMAKNFKNVNIMKVLPPKPAKVKK